jgi:hypothetical protein
MIYVSSGNRINPPRVKRVAFEYPLYSKKAAFKAAMLFDSLKRIF